MTLPFTIEQFMQVFREYNNAVFPMQIFLYLVAAMVIYGIIKNQPGQWIPGLLAFLWLWMGIVYHMVFFTEINPAAWLFGSLFILEGALLIYMGMRHRLTFIFRKDYYGMAGSLLLVYALVIYPVLGYAFGHVYPATPTFGLPCPTTIFTAGILLWSGRQLPRALLVIPLLWSLVGLSAAITLGIYEDAGLILSLAATFVLLLRKQKSTGGGKEREAESERETGLAKA